MSIRLSSQLEVIILPMPNMLTVSLKQMLTGDWYIIAGPTRSAPSNGTPGYDTGHGAYIGTSGRLPRVWPSLRRWTTGCDWRLQPQTLILVRSTQGVVDNRTRLLVEARLTRAISAAGYTVLNTHSGAPVAHRHSSRANRFWARAAADDLADLVLRLVFHGHQPAGLGGCTREQLVRLVLNANRALNIDEILTEAKRRNIKVAGKHPRQRTRRDLTTREADSGQPRVYRTHIGGRTVIYPATMTLREAREDYLRRHPKSRPHSNKHLQSRSKSHRSSRRRGGHGKGQRSSR